MSLEKGLADECEVLYCQERAMRSGLRLVHVILKDGRSTIGISSQEDMDCVMTTLVPSWEWPIVLHQILDVVEALNAKNNNDA